MVSQESCQKFGFHPANKRYKNWVEQRKWPIWKWVLFSTRESTWGLNIFSLTIFCSISREAMVLWTIEQRVFAHDCYVKNNESVTAFIEISLFPPIRQSYVGLMHFAHKIHNWIGNRWGPTNCKICNVSYKLCCRVPNDLHWTWNR